MTTMLRMGAAISVAADQAPMGHSFARVVSLDESGREVRAAVPCEAGLVFSVVHFVDLDDGSRVTTERFGEITMELPRASTLAEVRADARELIFEEEMRNAAAEELADEPLWDDMLAVLGEQGMTADEAALASLPFVVELDDSVERELKR